MNKVILAACLVLVSGVCYADTYIFNDNLPLAKRQALDALIGGEIVSVNTTPDKIEIETSRALTLPEIQALRVKVKQDTGVMMRYDERRTKAALFDVFENDVAIVPYYSLISDLLKYQDFQRLKRFLTKLQALGVVSSGDVQRFKAILKDNGVDLGAI